MNAQRTETDAAAEVAARAAEAKPLDSEGRFYAVPLPAGGTLQVIDLEEKRDTYRERPRRKVGRHSVHSVDALVAVLEKHGDEQSEVWADALGQKIVAVLDAHEAGAPRWEGHTATYAVQLTDAWKAWTSRDGIIGEQAAFAEHIEDRAVDIIEPKAATMLELAQTIQATIGVSFQSSKLLSNGERQLAYKESVEAKGGRAGQLEIPSTFTLALKPFEGSAAFKMTARLRYRITDGTLRVGYALERPNDVLREAFESVAEAVDERVTVPVIRGSR